MQTISLSLSAHERELLEERAAIIEFCGNETRETAERMAVEQLKDKRRRDLINPSPFAR